MPMLYAVDGAVVVARDRGESVQQLDDHRGTATNGPFNPPNEFVIPTRSKQGGKKLAFIINGKHTDESIS